MTLTPPLASHALSRFRSLRWGWLCTAALAACAQAGVNGGGPGGADDVGLVNDGNNAPGGSDGTTAPLRGLVGGPGNHYTLVGRFDASAADHLTYSFPNSKIGARFSGASAVSVSLANSGNDTFLAVLDGNQQVVLTPPISAAPATLPIASNLDVAATHTLWLIKRSEGNAAANDNSNTRTGKAMFYGFAFEGAGAQFKAPPQTAKRLIETIGDSAFTGYGNLNVTFGGPAATFYAYSEDATQSVPAALAAALQAEVINVSAAGKGMYQSVYNSDLNAQIPQLYQQTVPPNASPAYPFNDPPVDAVVVQAGSNDLAGANGSGTLPNPNAFLNAYVGLLTTIRTHRPTAPIYCLVTPAASGTDRPLLQSMLDQAVAARLAAGDAKVSAYDFFPTTNPNYATYIEARDTLNFGTGCEGHPSPGGAAFLGARLAAVIRAEWDAN